ncbi:Aste57867_14192 [Aphanomyces stellatus]|uniref:Aste57867_14192 protein n=1 Tax=Aphanomyces stellatus TaxID=120398 RepID=A0A485L042_9STRA|nr:hypothetical protein As57867_014141 [Aphanomyces stellatus]VFT91017.1 Aste57867_14192 [Aphanomyces stellatus]
MIFEYLTKVPKGQAIGVSIAASFGLSALIWGGLRYSGPDFGGAAPGEPKTTSAEWQAATRDYIIAQNMDPISRHRN